MFKRTVATAVSIFMMMSAVTVVMPVERAAAAAAAKEKSKSGMSGKERRQKCSAEWKDAKAAGKTAGMKWPKFYSDCNKRLKAT